MSVERCKFAANYLRGMTEMTLFKIRAFVYYYINLPLFSPCFA
jgi:hypothetical protein